MQASMMSQASTGHFLWWQSPISIISTHIWRDHQGISPILGSGTLMMIWSVFVPMCYPTKIPGPPHSPILVLTPSPCQTTLCKDHMVSFHEEKSATTRHLPMTPVLRGRMHWCGTLPDQAHWDRSTTIIDAWGSNLTDIIGIDRSLLIGLDGDLFVNAAEIMRWEGNWTEAGASWRGGSGFSNQLYWLFSRQAAVIGQANYGMVSIKSLLSFAVYLEDVTMYNYAMNSFINDPCASLFAMYNSKTGQSVESGRDQCAY